MTSSTSEPETSARSPLTRRNLIATTGLAAAFVTAAPFLGRGAAALASVDPTCPPGTTAPVPPPAKGPAIPKSGYLVEEIADRVYWLTDGLYQMIFLVTAEGVVAIDAPPTIGRNILRAIAKVTRSHVTHAVYSHHHADHTGAMVLYSKARFYAQRRVADWLAEVSWPKPDLAEFHLKLIAAAAAGLADPITIIDTQRGDLLRRLREAQRAALAEPDRSPAALLLEGIVLRLQADLRWLEACEQNWTSGKDES